MKKWMVVVLLPILLCGCRSEETFETVLDVWSIPAMAPVREIVVDLPTDASVQTMQSDAGQLYVSNGYEISIETMEAGDIQKTMRTVSGISKEDMTILETQRNGIKRYEFVWVAAGETGDQVGRSVILDDGDYHYVMTVLRDMEDGQDTPVNWNDVFRSFHLA